MRSFPDNIAINSPVHPCSGPLAGPLACHLSLWGGLRWWRWTSEGF